MVKNCCVNQCHTTGRNLHRPDKRISLHGFPKRDKSPVRYRQWLVKVNRKDFVPTTKTVVCSEHFTEDDYTLTSRLQLQLMPDAGNVKAVLKNTAVPSLKLRGPLDEPPKRRKSKYLENKAKVELLKEIPWPAEFNKLRFGRLAEPPPARPVSNPNRSGPPADRPAVSISPSPRDVVPASPTTRELDVQCDVGTETLVHARETKATLLESPSSETGTNDIDTLKRMFPARRLNFSRLGLLT